MNRQAYALCRRCCGTGKDDWGDECSCVHEVYDHGDHCEKQAAEVRALRDRAECAEIDRDALRAEVECWRGREAGYRAGYLELVRLVREYFSARESYVADPGVHTSAQLDRARHALLKAAAVRGDTEGKDG